ncbi:hypothetical protein Slin15195_G098640 [Septoria linicola]|uniref:PQ loop repeat protein n=1 Tax=Septoria linicola TaxID=215465 RepID=A0A9Q9B1M6_9PEZI|nr:hypothetical protein Slin14017_G061700 [Septoria linicola]USW56545.1 hypothetical protein Slin15195_G098640 [Septoria linicola]
MDKPAIANTFGTLGAVFWSIQLLPQIWLNYRRHNATGLRPSMMMLWAWAGVPLGVYNIVQNLNLALQVQPQILSLLSLLTWIQCYYYEHNWSLWKATSIVVPIAALMGGTELGLVYALRHGRAREVDWPVTLMAVLAALLLALGVLRHYWDTYTHRTVRGISFVFVGIDALGDLASIISVVFERQLNILALVTYGVELTLWTGIFAAGGYYNLRPWLKQRWTSRNQDDPLSDPGNSAMPEEERSPVALHDRPSSTSVFRTTSSDVGIRQRSHAAIQA